MLQQFMENYSPWEGFALKKFMKESLLSVGAHTTAGEECEEEGVSEKMHNELTATTIHHPLVSLKRKEIEKIGREVEPRKKREVRGVTESQNHRMVGVGRDLCGSSSPTPVLKQDHLEQAAQDHVWVGLEYLQRRRLHNLSGQPVPVLRHPQREEVLPHVQTELPVPQFVPIAPCPVTRHH